MGGMFDRARDLDQRAMDRTMSSRWVRRKLLDGLEPRGDATRTLWSELTTAERDTLRRWTVQGLACPDPHDALICADLADSHLEFLEREARKTWIVMAVMLVLVIGLVLATGIWLLLVGLPAGLIGGLGGVYANRSRTDHGRRANLAAARRAGLS